MRNTINSNIILASSSVHRKNLLKKYISDFKCIVPSANEEPFENECGKDLCIRLARTKAKIVSEVNPTGIVIGSDQVATYNEKNLGKPYTYESAFNTIKEFSGESVFFNTGVTILCKNRDIDLSYIDTTIIEFKNFTTDDLYEYLNDQKDFKTTAGVKTESKLFQKMIKNMISNDAEAIIGLPIKWTISQLNDILSNI
mgnify:CR=1 FL=1